MKLFLKLVSLIAVITAFTSCGSSEKTDDILRLGGISSTGNKDDEDSKDKKQDSSTPLMPGEMCKIPLDLSPRVYRKVAFSSTVACGNGEQQSECIVELRFESPSSFIAVYEGDSEELPLTTHAEYKACNQSLITSIPSLEGLRLSDNQKTIFHEKLGLVFKLVE